MGSLNYLIDSKAVKLITFKHVTLFFVNLEEYMQILIRDGFFLVIISLFLLICDYYSLKNSLSNLMGKLILCFCLFIIFSLTGVSPISGFHIKISLSDVQIIPFIDIFRMFNGNKDVFLKNIGGNIAIFMPLGFLLPLLWKEYKSIGKTLCLGIIISLFIEFSQLFLTRATDINDVILNSLGTLLGYFSYILVCFLLPALKDFFLSNSNLIERKSKKYFYLYLVMPYLVVVLLGAYDRIAIFLRWK